MRDAWPGSGHEPAGIPGVSPGLPGGLTVTATLPAALDLLETEIIRRLRIIDSGEDDTPALPPLALVARPDRTSAPRIEAILAGGPGTKVTAILLGNWPAGITCDTGPDGTVTAATSATLTNARAFCLSRGDTATLLALLRGAGGHTAGDPAGPYAAPAPAPPAAPSPRAPRYPPDRPGRTGESPAPDVGQGTADIGFRNDVEILFHAREAHLVKLRVRDEQGRPTTAAFLVRDDRNRVAGPHLLLIRRSGFDRESPVMPRHE